MPKTSIIIPSRNEQFLAPTVRTLLANAHGDIEVIVVLDGYWPPPARALPEDKRLRILHRGSAAGMRPAINWAAEAATGEFLMKMDAHCSITEGYDLELQKEIDRDWVVIPRRDRLDAEKWCKQETGKIPIDAHYLSYPYERPMDPACGLHGTVWNARSQARSHILFDDEMSSQGSCWFMHREHFMKRLYPLDVKNYGNFIQEFQEVGLKTQLGTEGGAVKVNKRVTYLHLHKGRTYGRGYSLAGSNHEAGARFATDFWMNDRWDKRVRNLRWLIEKFWPVPSWPKDLDAAFARARPTMISVGGKTMITIVSARYGIGTGEGEFVDVTEKVKSLATADGLEIPKVSNDLLGVGNPFQGQRKRLYVVYTQDGTQHAADALERKSLRLPLSVSPTGEAPATPPAPAAPEA